MGLNKTKWIFSFALGILFTGSFGFSDPSDLNKELQALGFSEESIQKINEKLDGRTIPIGKASEIFYWLQKIDIKAPLAFIEKTPSILGLSILENLEPKLNRLKEIGIKSSIELLEKQPAIFGYSIKENLEPKVEWLKKIGIQSPSTLLEKNPALFGYSIKENLEPKVKWLKEIGIKNYSALIEKFLQRLRIAFHLI